MMIEAYLLVLIVSSTFIIVLAKLLSLDPQQESALPLKIISLAQYALPLLLAIFCIRAFLFEIVIVQSDSMQPTLQPGDIILVDKFSYGLRIPILGTRLTPGEPQRADVAVFRGSINQQPTALIKRIVGIPGDQITYKDRTLYVNLIPSMPFAVKRELFTQVDGETIDVQHALETIDNQTYAVLFAWQQPLHNFKHTNIIVEAKSYYALGDYRDNSYDSRDHGLITDTNLIGKARYIVFSIDWTNKLIRWDRVNINIL